VAALQACCCVQSQVTVAVELFFGVLTVTVQVLFAFGEINVLFSPTGLPSANTPVPARDITAKNINLFIFLWSLGENSTNKQTNKQTKWQIFFQKICKVLIMKYLKNK
jgi:hypothetical protein